MADGPGIGATCTILMAKQRLIEKVPVRFRTSAWIDRKRCPDPTFPIIA
ncbi:hypothetical protein [Rhizobium leguminosarum]|nr:hypothetical protein [Rhizobium leguminosarum]MBY5332028.1 hypothetical protein [Rhizobium leguminosarum]